MARFSLLPVLVWVTPVFVFPHNTWAQSLFGDVVESTGDLDGDGVGDFAVGGPAHPDTENRGAVWAFSGRTAEPLYEIEGSEPGECFGSRVENVGDVDADGVLDFLVMSAPVSRGPDRQDGSGWVVSGRSGSPLYPVEHLHWWRSGRHGTQGGSAGDVDADGIPDFVVTSWPRSENGRVVEPGRVSMISGANGHLLWGVGAPGRDGASTSVDAGEDVTGDGRGDVVVGYPGGVAILSGRDGKEVARFRGAAPRFGTAVSWIDDLDGDGRSEFAVTTRGGGGPGEIELYSPGRSEPIRRIQGPPVTASSDSYQFGTCMESAGDLDGDGLTDLIVGDRGRWGFTGGVDAYSVGTGSRLWEARGGAEDWRFGTSVAAIGDVDDDGIEDVAIGCASWKQPSLPGTVRIVSGRDGATIRTIGRPGSSSAAPPGLSPGDKR